jgi:hypothetical protein
MIPGEDAEIGLARTERSRVHDDRPSRLLGTLRDDRSDCPPHHSVLARNIKGTEVGLPRGLKDLQGAFDVYVTIGRQRELTTEERARVEYLVDRMNAQGCNVRYRATHGDQIRAANIAWREANPDAVKAISRRYHERHASTRNARSRDWYRRNHEAMTARNRSRPIAIHLDVGGRALCGRSPAQGKRYDSSSDRASVSCGRCQGMIDLGKAPS